MPFGTVQQGGSVFLKRELNKAINKNSNNNNRSSLDSNSYTLQRIYSSYQYPPVESICFSLEQNTDYETNNELMPVSLNNLTRIITPLIYMHSA